MPANACARQLEIRARGQGEQEAYAAAIRWVGGIHARLKMALLTVDRSFNIQRSSGREERRQGQLQCRIKTSRPTTTAIPGERVV